MSELDSVGDQEVDVFWKKSCSCLNSSSWGINIRQDHITMTVSPRYLRYSSLNTFSNELNKYRVHELKFKTIITRTANIKCRNKKSQRRRAIKINSIWNMNMALDSGEIWSSEGWSNYSIFNENITKQQTTCYRGKFQGVEIHSDIRVST